MPGCVPFHRRAFLFTAFIALFLLPAIFAAGQGTSSGSVLSPAAEAAWAAAQEARGQGNYSAAEKEYRNVIRLSPAFAEAYMNLGLVYELENRRSDAVTAFREALRLKPGLAGARFFLGVDYCKLGEALKAIPHLEAAVREKPDLADAWSWLATAQKMAGQSLAQVKTLQDGLRSNPRSIDLLFMLGRAYEQLGVERIDRIQQKAPNSTCVEQLLAENYAASGYPSDALLHFQNALKDSPDRAGLHLEVGELFLHAGNLAGAQREVEVELARAPHDLRALVRRGEIRLLKGEVPGALADWSQALTVDSNRTEAILGVREAGLGETPQEKLPPAWRQQLAALRGRIESQAGPAVRLALAFLDVQAGGEPVESVLPGPAESAANPPPQKCTVKQTEAWLAEDKLEATAACASRVLKLPVSPQLRLGIARALFETARPEQALRALDTLAAADADSPPALYWRARCYKKLALATYLRLFRVDPDSYRAHEVLGDLHLARGEDAGAIEEYRKALERRPTLPNLHYQIGHLAWKVYKVEEARAQFLAELAGNPQHTGALFDLGNTYMYERQPGKALEFLKLVEKLDPKYPDVHQFLGMAYSRLGKYAEAEAELKQAAPADKDGRVHYQLARVYQALKRPADAQREFAASDQIKKANEQKNEERTQRLVRAEAALKQL